MNSITLIATIFGSVLISALLGCSAPVADEVSLNSTTSSHNLKSESRSNIHNIVDIFPENDTLRRFQTLRSLEKRYPHVFDYDTVAYPGKGPDGEYSVIYGQHCMWKLVKKSDHKSVATIFVVADDHGYIDWDSSRLKVSKE